MLAPSVFTLRRQQHSDLGLVCVMLHYLKLDEAATKLLC